ncbi:MAG TPA: hypothetical protein VFO16_18180 [Pseudonocardiaceae bacterium]|nr:hypothetical protein [Pseudonocardiaceae bacterium]
MGLPSGGPRERLRLDPAPQDSGMCPACEVMRDFLSSPGGYDPSPAGKAVLDIARKISRVLGSPAWR